MKYSIALSALLVASVSFAAPAKKTATKTKATTAQAAPVTTAPATTAPIAPDTATVTTPSTASAAAIQVPSQEKITGILETRPTVSAKGPNNVTTENTIGLGYRYSDDFEVGAVQYFDTNVLSNNPARKGVDVIVQDAFVRAKFNNLYKTETVSFGYEPRLYLPTRASFRDAGGIAAVRNYFKVAYKASNSVTLTAMDLPILQFYNKAGTGTVANPAFENRVYLIADFDLGKGFALSLPLYFHQTKLRSYAPAANSGQWDFFVYTWPEVTYAVAPNVTVGAGFYTGNLMTPTLGGFTIADGFKNGAFQAILGVTL